MIKIILIKVIFVIFHQIICKQKEQGTETHLLSDDEVDELAVLLGINLYSAEDHRIFISEITKMMIEGEEYLLKKIN